MVYKCCRNPFRLGLFTILLIFVFFMTKVPSRCSADKVDCDLQQQISITTPKLKRSIWGHLCLEPAKPHDSANEPKFYLFTRNNRNIIENLFTDDLTLNKNFAKDIPTKIIIHGYKSDIKLTPLVEMKDEYLTKGEHNVIFVDWEKLADDDCYLHAIKHCRYVSNTVAEIINKLKEAGAENIHVIGFSLGAQMTAFIANHLSPYKLPRITGLDPAMPGFITVGKEDKLDVGDAEFVDVYHTNAMVQGKVEECGHVDFYFNGGVTQPGCHESTNCDHTRAPEYFAESINSQIGFWGWPCTGLWKYTWGLCPPNKKLSILAGDGVKQDARGFFIVKTNAQKPFAKEM